MICQLTGIRGRRQAVTLWTAQGESVVLQADTDRVRALALQWWEWEALRRMREGPAL